MILQALCDYYQRKQQAPDTALPPYGFEEKAIPFLIVIDKSGRFIQFEDTRELSGKKAIARNFMVSKSIKKTSGVAANLLWDPADYVLGIDVKGKPERTEQQLNVFIATIRKQLYEAIEDEGIAAIFKFYEQLSEQPLQADPNWPAIVESNPVLTFRLSDEIASIVFNRPHVLAAYRNLLAQDSSEGGLCLATGKQLPIATLHPSVKGVWGAQSSGASVVSFNQASFTSWGKDQGANSPVSERAAFEYTTALNYLLRTECPNRFQIGETSVVCWAEQDTSLETTLPLLFSDAPKDNPDAGVAAVSQLFATLHNGAYLAPDGRARFYLLGLSPNAARIAVRFWQVGTVAEFAERLGVWFGDIDLIGREKYGFSPLKVLLRSTALLGKDENLSPYLAGETVRAIMLGLPLPASLLAAAIGRLKAEPGQVTYTRAALIKACLNRKFRFTAQAEKELTVSLNPEDTRIGYRLGRLFAVLEKLQTDANPGLNATIRDRYYSSASCTPKAVFGTLLRLHTHHLKKLENPAWRAAAERRIADILGAINAFPAHMSLEDQGLFAIGYYHQRQDLFTKKDSIQGEAQ